MGPLSALIVLASISHGQWFCTAGLLPGKDAPFTPVKIDFALDERGNFQATGTVTTARDAHRFDWDGSWTTIEGQLAMIGKTRGRTFGLAPAGELRAIASVTHADVIMLSLSSTSAPGRVLRCLTYPTE